MEKRDKTRIQEVREQGGSAWSGTDEKGTRRRVTAPGSRALDALQLLTCLAPPEDPGVSTAVPLLRRVSGGSCFSWVPCAGSPLCAPAALRSSDRRALTGGRSAACGPGGGTRAQQGGRGREGAAEEAGLGSAPLSPPTGVSHLPYIQTRGRWRWRTMRKHPWRERSPQLINSDPRPRPASQVVVPKPTLSDHRSLINIPCHKFGPKPIHSV